MSNSAEGPEESEERGDRSERSPRPSGGERSRGPWRGGDRGRGRQGGGRRGEDRRVDRRDSSRDSRRDIPRDRDRDRDFRGGGYRDRDSSKGPHRDRDKDRDRGRGADRGPDRGPDRGWKKDGERYGRDRSAGDRDARDKSDRPQRSRFGERRDSERRAAPRDRDDRRDSRAPRGGRDLAGRGGHRDGARGRYGSYRGGDRDQGRRPGRDRDRDRDRPDREQIRRLPIPDEVTGEEVDRAVRQELMSLPKTLAADVARNLVMVGRLLDEDPQAAYGYARIALRLASRVAAVREAAGFAAYGVTKYAEALNEFRAARRMSGADHLWPVMADCERGLGRPEKALAMAGEPEVRRLDKAGQVEMRMVAAGARRDMGQVEAAVVTLQSPELASTAVHPWTARLRYAYADALLAVGREDEARTWFARALEADQGGTTNASDRLAELDGLEFVDALDPDAEEDDRDPGGTDRE